MNAARIVAVLLIAAGTLALIYHGFSYSRDTHEAKIGSLDLSIQRRESVDIPTWAGVAAIVAGAAVLVMGGSKR